jgi:hypothetical protein
MCNARTKTKMIEDRIQKIFTELDHLAESVPVDFGTYFALVGERNDLYKILEARRTQWAHRS